jgi:hypothetical protein
MAYLAANIGRQRRYFFKLKIKYSIFQLKAVWNLCAAVGTLAAVSTAAAGLGALASVLLAASVDSFSLAGGSFDALAVDLFFGLSHFIYYNRIFIFSFSNC